MMDKLRETKLKLIYFHNSEGFIKYVKMHLTGGATLKHTRNEMKTWEFRLRHKAFKENELNLCLWFELRPHVLLYMEFCTLNKKSYAATSIESNLMKDKQRTMATRMAMLK